MFLHTTVFLEKDSLPEECTTNKWTVRHYGSKGSFPEDSQAFNIKFGKKTKLVQLIQTIHHRFSTELHLKEIK